MLPSCTCIEQSDATYFIGIDVGTSSVRAGLVTKEGSVRHVSSQDIKIWTPKPGFYEQSSDDIWKACCTSVQDVIVAGGVLPKDVKGIGVDATCSLVVLGTEGKPITVSPTGSDEQNVVMWMDHRAVEESEMINRTNHPVLKYVGGKISPEMETPKLLWLKKNLKETWKRAGLFLDLPDFLTWKATGAESRSLCSLVCKWTYEVEGNNIKGWNKEYFTQIGLEDLAEENWKRIGSEVKFPGQPCGKGLSDEAARDLGLLPGTPVGTSLIDAHAGGLAMIGTECYAPEFDHSDSRICIINGTSTCHMAVSEGPIFVPGVWGPYFSAMVPSLFLNEGGMSVTGKLLDHIIDTHPAKSETIKEVEKTRSYRANHDIQQQLNLIVTDMATVRGLPSPTYITENVHVYPDFHGNRSPLADPTLLGMISGLDLGTDMESLALLYLATVQAIAYGTKHIIETLEHAGYRKIKAVVMGGGLRHNDLFMETHANALNVPVLLPEEQESMILGSAMLAACASGVYRDLDKAIKAMSSKADSIRPNSEEHQYHLKKYEVFLKMLTDQRSYQEIMKRN